MSDYIKPQQNHRIEAKATKPQQKTDKPSTAKPKPPPKPKPRLPPKPATKSKTVESDRQQSAVEAAPVAEAAPAKASEPETAASSESLSFSDDHYAKHERLAAAEAERCTSVCVCIYCMYLHVNVYEHVA